MRYASTTDPKFLGTLEAWFQIQPEVFTIISYAHAAGSKDFEFFSSFEVLTNRMLELPPLACVTAFRQPQLPIRGMIDDSFIATCLSSIPDGSEYLMVETERRVFGRASWFRHWSGASHAELRKELEQSHGNPVAVGLYPPCQEETDEIISAVVPDEHGVMKPGLY